MSASGSMQKVWDNERQVIKDLFSSGGNTVEIRIRTDTKIPNNKPDMFITQTEG